MVIRFDQLEYWVTTGIIEADHVTDAAKQANIAGKGFERRVRCLEKAFTRAEIKGWITPDCVPGGSWRLFLPELLPVSQRRNDLIHGVTMSVSVVDIKGRRFAHTKYNPKSGQYIELNTADIEQVSQTIEARARRLQIIVLNLCAVKQSAGIERPSGWG